MLTKNQDRHRHSRKIRMDFMNPPHLEDSLAHCRQHGLIHQFNEIMGKLRDRATIAACEGSEMWIRVIPTSKTQPTFYYSIHEDKTLIESGNITYSTILREWSLVPDK